MNNKTTTESATTEIEERTGSYLQLSFSRALKMNHDALAELESILCNGACTAPG